MSTLIGLVLEFLAWFIFELLIGAIVEGFKALYRAFFPLAAKPISKKRKIRFT